MHIVYIQNNGSGQMRKWNSVLPSVKRPMSRRHTSEAIDQRFSVDHIIPQMGQYYTQICKLLTNWCIMPILSLLFFINPLVGITSWIWVALRNIDKTSWTAIRGLALFLSLYLGMINSTKELHGDFLAYNEYYRDALQMPFLEYLL